MRLISLSSTCSEIPEGAESDRNSISLQRWRGWGIKTVKRAVGGRGEHFCGGERDT